MDRFHPGYFGKVGMRHYHLLKNKYYQSIINIDKLFTLLPEDVVKQALEKKDKNNAPIIDCVKHGYFKVLGKGSIPAVPIIVKAREFSKEAEKKIVDAGGACILAA